MTVKSSTSLAFEVGNVQTSLLLLLIAVLPLSSVFAFGERKQQDTYRVQHQAPTVIERDEPVNFTFDIPAINATNVQDAFVFYKYDGEISFRQQRAKFAQGVFKTSFTIDNPNASSLEYFFAVEITDGRRITFPASQPRSDPVRVDILDPGNRDNEASGIDFTILSPEPGSTLRASDVLVALTLFYEEGAVDTAASSFILHLDDKDITEQAEASDYFFSYSPDQISPGQHHASLQLATPEDTLQITSWEFNVLDPNQSPAVASGGETAGEQESGETWMPRGRVELTAQNQQVGGIGNDVMKGDVQISGSKDNIRYSVNGLLTSQETSRLQPQNRYGAELYVGDWLEVQGGHIYPTLSRLSIAGRRVQGINSTVHAFDGAVNAQVLYGKMNRKISNLYNEIQPDIVRQTDGTPVDTTYSLGFSNGGVGTFKREITGGRLSVGRGRTFQWGVNFLKVRDDTTSLTNIRNFNDLMNERPDLANNLETEFRNDLQSNPEQLGVSGTPQPKDNFVAGSDLMFNLFDNKVRFRSETAVSLLNDDISSGVLSNTSDFDLNLSEDVSSELDRWSWLIIINENMNALPLRFDVQDNEPNVESVYFPTSILANQSELNLNLSENNLRMQYRWIGPNYVSLSNSTIRRDVAGLTLSDRFQLFQNRLYVTLGYENLNDNVSNTKDATTNTQTARTNVSWFPVDQHLPRVSFGFMYRNRDNAVPLNNPFVGGPGQAENIAVRNFEISQGDTVITANPRLNNTAQVTTSISQEFNLFDMTHDASVNFSYLNTEDEYFRFGDTQSNLLSLTVQSRFSSLPLNTKVGFNVNNTETLGGLSDIQVLGFNLGGTLILMDDKLNLNTNLAFTKNNIDSTPLQIYNNGTSDPRDDIYQAQTDAFGDRVVEETRNNLVILRGGAQYRLDSNHSFLVNFSYTNVKNQLAGLNPPNDHMLQARYIYSF